MLLALAISLYFTPENAIKAVDKIDIKLFLMFAGACLILIVGVMFFLFLYIPGPRRLIANCTKFFYGIAIIALGNGLLPFVYQFSLAKDPSEILAATSHLSSSADQGKVVVGFAIFGCCCMVAARLICERWKLVEDWEANS